jgi:hypothetical protein
MSKKTEESKISISKNDFIKFIDLLRLKGEIENKSALLFANSKNIEVLAVSNTKTVATRGQLKLEREDLGEIGIDNLQLLRGIVNTLGETIDLKRKDNKWILISKNVTAEVAILKNEYIKNKITNKEFEALLSKAGGNDFTLSPEGIKTIINIVNAIDTSYLILEGNGKWLSVKVDDNNNNILANIEMKEEVKPFKCKVGKNLLNILSQLESETFFSISNNNPIYIKNKSDSYIFEYLIAPIKMD